MSDDPTLREKIRGVRLVAGYRPKFALGIVALNLVTAVFEGIGVGLLLPLIEVAQRGGDVADGASGMTAYFLTGYEFIGLPFTLETLVIGLAFVMAVRYGLSFLTTLLQVTLRTKYITHLREQCFEQLLVADVSHIDEREDDDMINTVVTEIPRSSGIIMQLLGLVQTVFFIVIYVGVAVLIAPRLTAVTVSVLGTIVFLTRYVIQPGYEIGDRVATANERIQGLVNAGTRGIREIKLFNMSADIVEEYERAHSRFARTNIALARNQAALSNFNQLLNVLALFAVVYFAVDYLSLSLASLGVFLFAMFRLSPQISSLNNALYEVDGVLPSLLRCHELVEELRTHAESSGSATAPDPVREIRLADVTFQYDGTQDGTDITDVSLRVGRGETVALAGPSGAGKSTIVSLIAKLYTPDSGRIYANGADLARFDRDSWHDRVAVVPQRPFVFNETLRYNVAIGDPAASDAAIRRACEISRASAFVEELPDGLNTELGDDGVRLSGGQRQRVAIARALLTDADVLLLDEATSELDSPTEEAILADIEALDREYLTVVVGHQLAAVKDADRIYTVVDGEVVESGTHRELIDTDSHYATLYDSRLESSARK